MKLGCIGDDFTGSSDLANTLAKEGMTVVQYTGVPDEPAGDDVEAGVVSLKSRSIAPKEAVRLSLEALEWLKAQGCSQFFFKYCSTFDSTQEGNIGPVADALADALDAHKVIFCPAFPGTGRSVYQGHLFVNDALLSESGMENHPLTPMTDPDLRRWLSHQTQHTVGHVSSAQVFQGVSAIANALDELHLTGHRHIVVDAIRDEDLRAIGRSAANLPLVTGGSGVALGLPANFGYEPKPVHWRGQKGPTLIISGSCSIATRAQVAQHATKYAARELTAAEIIAGKACPADVLAWAQNVGDLPLVYTSADPDVVTRVQETYGKETSANAIETFFSELAQQACEAGFTKIITAGGETSGAVVEGLNLSAMEIGPEIDPGVPALRAGHELAVALKSGNFGAPDFFEKASRILNG